MKLEECIEYFEIEAETSDSLMMPYEPRKKYFDDCKQMAEWLRELKYYKDRQDLINKSWQEFSYKEGIEKIKIRSQAYRECGETVLANGMEQALDILGVNADED